MDPRHLDLAAEFCELVGKPNLLAYLGLPEGASPEAAQKKLRARRKYMQGMQSNPKYRAEAIFLIKNFAALNAVLANPIPYLEDARRRAESQHIPILEMTIKGVLAGGSLNYDQEDYLRRNAIEIGVSEATFEELLDRLAREAKVPRATDRLTITPEEFRTTDFYQVLGVPRHASRDEIYARYRARAEEAKRLPDPARRSALRTEIEKAWKVLSDEKSRREYDLAWTATGPPARTREVARPVSTATAPPVQPRKTRPPAAPFADLAPSPTPRLAPPKLELLSRAEQQVTLGTKPVELAFELRNAGEQPLSGNVTTDAPWLQILTPELENSAKRQTVRVRILPDAVSGRSARGVVRIDARRAGRAEVTIEVRRPPNYAIPAAIGAGTAVLVLAGVVWAWLGSGPAPYTIEVDPWAEQILLDGEPIGSGKLVTLDAPVAGEATITVRHPNFKPWVKDVRIEPGGHLAVELVLDNPMSFRPTEEHRLASLDPQVAVKVMTPFQPALDRCLRSGIVGNQEARGVVRIHVGEDGRPIGFDASGPGTSSPAVQACLARQTAGPLFPRLTDGDYATVKYEYVLPPR